MRAEIVVGLGYGDEGKGKVVSHLCAHSPYPKQRILVVRFNGGHQAGHTTIVDEIKHVSSTFGSGVTQGIDTYLTEHCVFSPTMYLNERRELVSRGIIPNEIILHPLVKICTPFDVDFNKFLFTQNPNVATCGVGFGVTLERHEDYHLKIHAAELLHPIHLKNKLYSIVDYMTTHGYFPNNVDEVIDKFMVDCENTTSSMNSLLYTDLLDRYSHLIFEGAQGTMLDQDHGIFPHVTRSNTTIKNAIEVINQLNTQVDIHTFFVTRSYSTRHGSGPFEEASIQLINNEDEINVENEYQGKFKIGEFNMRNIIFATMLNMIYSNDDIISENLVITCVDQRPDFVEDYLSDAYTQSDLSDYTNVFLSYGPGTKLELYMSSEVKSFS